MKVRKYITKEVYFEGKELADIMSRKGVTVEKLADKTELSMATIQGIKEGRVGVSLQWAGLLARRIYSRGVSVDMFPKDAIISNNEN